MIKMRFGLLLLSTLFALNLGATNYHCDPVSGNMSNEGSFEHPWSSLQMVLEAGKTFSAGDTIFLHAGDHGSANILGRNDDYVVIKAFGDGDPVLQSLRILGGSYWLFDGVHIGAELPSGSNVYTLKFLVESNANADHLIFQSCQIYSTLEDISAWTQMDWFERTSCGFRLMGSHSLIHDCTIKNINFGISIEGRYSEVMRTTIENFVGDGIRALSSDSRYEDNTVMNSFDVTGYSPNLDGSNPDFPTGGGNHDDLFQSYAAVAGGGEQVVRNVVVRGNRFIVYTDPDQIQKSACQGIGCFDGYFDNWVVENNLVIADNWHGITFLGINNSTISNNTVIHNPIFNDLKINGSSVDTYRPWIWLGKMKDFHGGGPSTDNIIRNNLVVHRYANEQTIRDDGTNTVVENNQYFLATEINSHFFNFDDLDLHLKAGAPSIDQGINTDLPVFDLDQNPRLFGNAVDCGAYEYQSGTPDNHCPHLEPIEKQGLEEEQLLDVSITASDPDDDPVTLTASGLEDFMVFTDHADRSGTLNCTPVKGDAGSYRVTIEATDGISINTRSFMVDVAVSTVGISQEANTQSVLIYPNPVRLGEALLIEVPGSLLHGGVNLEIFSMTGALLYRSYHERIDETLQVETSVLGEGGSYIIRIAEESHLLLVY
ncbi:MAG: choice-of-anchor Q domain-containing protein [Bacteroidota bacterium]